MSISVGILSVQGDVQENLTSVRVAMDDLGIDGSITAVNGPKGISCLDGLIIPGGESTSIGQMCLANNSMNALKEKIAGGMPVLGICAGMIMLSKSTSDRIVGKTDQPLLDVLDITLERNSFGRQRKSFEANIEMASLGIHTFNGVFIRAPSVSDVGSGVEVLSKFGEKIVAVKKDNIIGTAFHPELASDVSLYKYFVNLVLASKSG